MIFDRLAMVTERWLSVLRAPMGIAALLDLPDPPPQELPHEFDAAVLAFLTEAFFLPFPVVAVEDRASCVLLWDGVENQAGLGGVRYFADCLPLDGSNAGAYKRLLDHPARKSLDALGGVPKKWMPKDTVLVTYGRVKSATTCQETKRRVRVLPTVEVTGAVIADQRRMVPAPGAHHPEVRQQLATVAAQDVRVAYEDLFYSNTPSRLVVESKPLREPRVLAGHFPRSNSRPRYAFWTVEETVRAFEGKVINGRGFYAPHSRRRHHKHVDVARFVLRFGQSSVVPACWLGPTEAILRGRHYRVRVDL